MQTRTKVIFAGVVLAALSGAAAAEPRINVDVNFGLPGFGYVAPAPVYYYPPAVVYAPAPRFATHHHYPDWDRRHYRHDYQHDYRHDDRRRW